LFNFIKTHAKMATKKLFFAFLLVVISVGGYAQQTFKGKIVSKPWSKTGESYCAQGSDYYVLEQKGKSNMVLKNEGTTDLTTFQGKEVIIKGIIEIRKIEPSSNPNVQQPIGMDGKPATYTCKVLAITEIKLRNPPKIKK